MTNPESIDELSYTYYTTSNQLKRVFDASNSIEGFKDVSSGDTDYTYDTHGNMTSDLNKNITQIIYNHLNLPKKISFQSVNYIEYTYDASGIKVKKKVKEGTTVSTTDYLDGYQYNNDKLQFFPHAEGYVKHILVGANDDVSVFEYVYQYKDHLGNVRVNYAFSKGAIYILDEQHYYPFGLEHGKYNRDKKEYKRSMEAGGNDLVKIEEVANSGYQYKYNGKELQDELDLQWYDYQARNYDPALGRWFNPDPLAEMSRRYSPYAYALDNPVYFVDPDGMLAEGFSVEENDWKDNGDGTYTAEKGDSASTLATDANISYQEANTLVQEQHGENKVDDKGNEFSNIKEGDVVAISTPERDIGDSQTPAEKEYTSSELMDAANRIEDNNNEISINEKKIDSTNKKDYQKQVTVKSADKALEISADGVYGKSYSLGMQLAKIRAEKKIEKSTNFKDSLRKVNNQKKNINDSLSNNFKTIKN